MEKKENEKNHSVWNFGGQSFLPIYDYCDEAFSATDLNNNSYISFFEAVVALSLAGTQVQISDYKMWQIDCSACLLNKTLYYY